jgi:peptidoglycan hydrolase-like protein with peptidoglycan-binding domain
VWASPDVTQRARTVAKVRRKAALAPAQRPDAVAEDIRGVLTPARVVALQPLVGNRAVSRLINVQRVGQIITPAPKAGESAHPTLSKGATNNEQAVNEAQQKLATSPGGPTTLAATGKFDDATEAAVKAFQHKNGLTESGTVDKATWEKLDAQGKTSVGRIERPWEETLGGTTYGMKSQYSYAIDDKKILVSVGINFVSDATHPPKDLAGVVDKWKKRILGRWNQFKALKDDGKQSRDIVFDIVSSGGNTVTVIDADVGSDAGHWSVPDNEHDNGPAHEFGHMIGLADEYNQTLSEYQRLHPGITEDETKKAKGVGGYGADTYTDKNSMMGLGALKAHDDKAADPEPRHVREFASFVEQFLGGKWDAARK